MSKAISLKLAAPLLWASPLAEINGTLYHVLAISDDRLTLTVEPA